MTMAMFGANVAIRLARPRAPTAVALSSSPCLSQLFNSQRNLAKNDDVSASQSSRSITTTTAGGWRRPTHNKNNSTRHQNQINDNIRWFSSKEGDADQEPPPSASNEGDDDNNLGDDTISGSSQHDAWVQFQRSIAVTGFDTGQTVKERTLGKKSRGGEMSRKRKEREAEAEAALKGTDNTQLKGGEFPELRYSDEETERLLAEAYAAIPPRAGKRGTLNLKRQHLRWFIKREYDYKKKREGKAAYTKKIAKLQATKARVKEVRAEAVELRNKDAEYRDEVLQRWAAMEGHDAGLRGLEEGRKEELASLGWRI